MSDEVRVYCFFLFKQKTAYEMRISDWSADVCSSDLLPEEAKESAAAMRRAVSEQIKALQDLSQLVGRSTQQLEVSQPVAARAAAPAPRPQPAPARSEARRVGKECVSSCI